MTTFNTRWFLLAGLTFVTPALLAAKGCHWGAGDVPLGANSGLLPDAGGDDGGDEKVESGPSPTNCEHADVFMLGLQKQGSNGMTITLLEADPVLPEVGEFNTWRVRLTDASGEPVTNATLLLESTMPEHNHRSNVPLEIVPLGGGEFEIGNVYPSMEALWRFEFQISAASGGTDTVVFQFCI